MITDEDLGFAWHRHRVDTAKLVLIEYATTVVMKKHSKAYAEERRYPEYVDVGGEA